MGLIFLSAMASSIAALCAEKGYAPEEALGTSLISSAISTLVVGLLIIMLGERRPDRAKLSSMLHGRRNLLSALQVWSSRSNKGCVPLLQPTSSWRL